MTWVALYGAGVALVGLVVWLARSRPGSPIGFLTLKTIREPTVWRRATGFAGVAFMLAGLSIVACGLLLPAAKLRPWFPVLLVVPVALALSVSLVYQRRL